MRLAYPVHLTLDEEDGGFVVTFPDFPEAITQGESVEDALKEAADCLDEAVAGRLRLNEDLPTPLASAAEYVVDVSAQLTAKFLLREALRESKLNKIELAKRLNCDEKEVRRLLDPRHGSKLTGMENAFHALGRRLVITTEQFSPNHA
jgi:antitoxin HicB